MMLQIAPPAPPVPPDVPQVFVQSGGPPVWAFVIPIVAIIVTGIVLYPLLRALARRIENKVSGGVQEELDELRSRIMTLEEQAMRVPELEERVDFAERLLANARESDRLREG
jgi:flagellar biosynthesis/type III secretory pathway M-ring protein FliF/YscJ